MFQQTLAGRLVAALLMALAATTTLQADEGPSRGWPMWGGRPDRNMMSQEQGLPETWGGPAHKNIRWIAALGSRTFGNPVVSGGKVFIGTNNDVPRDPRIAGDRGVLMCFAEDNGRFLWQAVHEKLHEKEANDWPEIGICSTPCVVGDRVYYVSNRGELVCADIEGFRDGRNDGAITDEAFTGPTGADFIWKLDMVKELSVVPHHASASPPLVVGDLVFVVTGNGVDLDHEKVPAPSAPSFIAVNRETGKLAWSDNSPGARIIDGQWSGAAFGVVNGKPQVVFPGGDGRLYAFEPETGKRIWTFDCNAGETDSKNHFMATPVFHNGKVFVAVGQDPENGNGPGCLWAINATGTGDVTSSGVAWRYGGEQIGRSLSTVAISGGLLHVAELQGYLHCVDLATGQRLWRHDLKAPVWGSPLAADRKVYIGNEDGDIAVFQQGRTERRLAMNAMKETVYGTPAVANGTIYLADRTHLYAIGLENAPAATQPAPAPAQERAAAAWPMARGNAQLTGVASSTLPGNLRLRWRVRTGDLIESSAAIADGTVYVGSDDQTLYAIDLAGGTIRWKYKAGGAIKSSPCVREGNVLFGADDGVLRALDTRTGAERWNFRAQAEIVSSPNCAGDRVLFGSWDTNLYCLEVGTGRLLWKMATEGRVHGTPGICGENVLVAGCDETLHIVRISDGAQVGEVAMGGYSGASAAICGKLVVVGTFENQVLGIDYATRKIAWTYQPSDRALPFYSSAAVTEGTVVVGGRDKQVHALETRTGKARWTFATQGRVDSSPVICGERVFAGSADGNLYALNLQSGKLLWRFDAGSPIVSSPAIGEGCLVVGAEDGTLYCFSAP